ncbi:MAG: DUF1489 family protein [Alphaproteobacteria bacterium]
MSVHLLKPALRANDVYEFAARQQQWHMNYAGQKVYPVWTSRKPLREKELLDGGSVFWIVKKQIQCRQKILAVEPYQEKEEKPSFLILCDTQLIRIQPIAKRPFQGWRYLQPDNASPDIGPIYTEEEPPPPGVEKILREAGLL